MKTRKWYLLSLVVILSLLLAPSGSVMGQDGTPPPQPQDQHDTRRGGQQPDQNGVKVGISQEEGPEGAQSKGGLWFMSAGAMPAGIEAEGDIAAMSKPDKFGYSWKSIPYNWIDTSGGTRLDLTENYDGVLVDLPFTLKFYENSYDQLMVNYNGYLQMGETFWGDSQSTLGYAGEPNNVIAPYWSPFDAVLDGVWMLTGGVAPDQYVVISWINAYGDVWDAANYYMFQVVLHENGDILYQYGAMDYGWNWWCATAGIEDLTATNSLTSLKYCTRQKSYKAYLFSRPAPGARLRIYPLDYGQFAAPGQAVYYLLQIKNTGELGNDTFDLSAKSKWPLVFYAGDGMTLLTDTDGDRKVDTGQVAEGEEVAVFAAVTPPVTMAVGKSDLSTVTVASSLKTSRKLKVNLKTAIPANFTQVYTRTTGSTRDLNMIFASPEFGELSGALLGDRYAYNPAVLELLNGNVLTAWSEYTCDDTSCHEEILYTIHDHNQVIVRDVSKLEDLTGIDSVNDYSPRLTQSPDGNIGVAWLHEEYDDFTGMYFSNIYFTVLNADGDVNLAPLNLTNATAIQNQDFYDASIAQVGGNRFAVAYEIDKQNDDGYWEDNIYLTILDHTGLTILPAQQITNDTGDTGDRDDLDDQANFSPNLATLQGNNVLLVWNGWVQRSYTSWSYALHYMVFNSAGQPVTANRIINLAHNYSYDPDAAQMSDGQIVIAWRASKNGGTIYYTVLNGSTYKKTKGPVPLAMPAALTGSSYPSVTVDQENHAIITWMDSDYSFGKHLYYTLLGRNGVILTKPGIFETNGEGIYLSGSYSGSGNSTYTP